MEEAASAQGWGESVPLPPPNGAGAEGAVKLRLEMGLPLAQAESVGLSRQVALAFPFV